jgi:DNA mismatch repair protein MutL
MKQKIRILPENLCNKIAAGEVVERPASVVKELLENSLDAGATEIRVEIESGGRKLIKVIDNGRGMDRDDVFLCLERHATSKIGCDEDLFRLHSFGFRGEALPSIAAVSRLTLASRSAESDAGWEIYAEGGSIKRAGEVGIPCGTTIEVRDLFFNTPARRKFLRQEETEFGHIGDVVTKLGLAQPAVRFSLVHRGRTLIDLYRHGTLAERVAELLGRPLLREMLPLEVAGPDAMKLAGLISQPAVNRATSGAMYAFINGRYIRDRVVQHALLEGYRHLLVKGRYPALVLFLEIDPALVDVNVHPTKHEVRFHDQKKVHDFIVMALQQTLRSSSWLGVAAAAPAGPAGLPSVPSEQVPREAADPVAGSENPADACRHGVREALLGYGRSEPAPIRPVACGEARSAGTPFVLPEPETTDTTAGFFSSLQVIGQYRRSFIVCQDGDDLVLIDQHAAHERIGFERLRAEFRQGRVERQALLFPAMLEFEFREAAQLTDHLGELERLGFELEPFGGRAFALKAIPRLLGDARAEQLVRDVAAELVTLGKSGLIEAAVDEILILMACHGMIRANQSLAAAEINALLRDLDRVDFSAHCPHGRPVLKRLPLPEVERMFRRS